MVFYTEEEGRLKCRKHPSKHRTTGVCPVCLRDRLIRLCPDCANVRPCGCYPTASSSSSSSSFSLSSSSDAGIGAVGRMAHLIDNEPSFQRSRSAAFPFLRSKISDKDTTSTTTSKLPHSKSWFWSSIFKAQKETKYEEMRGEEKKKNTKITRSKSVGISSESDRDVRMKGRSWHFPSPIKAFRQSRILHERSPLCRG